MMKATLAPTVGKLARVFSLGSGASSTEDSTVGNVAFQISWTFSSSVSSSALEGKRERSLLGVPPVLNISFQPSGADPSMPIAAPALYAAVIRCPRLQAGLIAHLILWNIVCESLGDHEL